MKTAIVAIGAAGLLLLGCGGEERIHHTKAQVLRTGERLRTLQQALEVYAVDIGHYPTEDEGGLAALTTKPSGGDARLQERWREPYLKGEAIDAWGRPFLYEVVPADQVEKAGVPYRLWSKGPDGKSGTADDVSNAPEKAPAAEAKP